MAHLQQLQFRHANASDSETIAQLHADSWRRHYRGAYSDTFLDGNVGSDRISVWSGRLRDPDAACCTLVAEGTHGLVGFAHTVLDGERDWGALLDNLHVAHTHQRAGIGTRLLVLSAEAAVERRPQSGLYLWVLEQNERAQAFYAALGGECVGRGIVEPPGGDPTRLDGNPVKLRYAWPEPAKLLR